MPAFEIVILETPLKYIANHIEARVTCLDTQDTRVVNWDRDPEHQKTPLTKSSKKLKQFNSQLASPSCLHRSVTLYCTSKKTMDQFSTDLKRAMESGHTFCDEGDGDSNEESDDYSVLNNCSDAVNYTLNYFFPNNEGIEIAWKTFKCVTFPAYIATLGYFPCLFGAPPGINHPKDVMKKAWLLSFKYGKKSTFDGPEYQLMLDEMNPNSRNAPLTGM
ncbi:MAG TPA: hypothetical protein VLI69_03965 [Gammaproteobacteria bacterium]|nr:hypothetical protein [Gammaproteobacteria bacterium]